MSTNAAMRRFQPDLRATALLSPNTMISTSPAARAATRTAEQRRLAAGVFKHRKQQS
jgi:hypothetical protein